MATLMRFPDETDEQWERRKGQWYRAALEAVLSNEWPIKIIDRGPLHCYGATRRETFTWDPSAKD